MCRASVVSKLEDGFKDMDDHQKTLAQLRENMALEAAAKFHSNTPPQNTLLGLPHELRDLIWSHVLDGKYENVNHWHSALRGWDDRMFSFQTPSPRTTMLQVSRQFSEEGKKRLYQHSPFRVNCDTVTGLTLPVKFQDTHLIRNIELHVDHLLFLKRNPACKLPRYGRHPHIPYFPRQAPPRFLAQLYRFGSAEPRAERCTFYLNTTSQQKEHLPLVIPVLHALKGFETLILKIAVCPRRFSSPASAWLLSEPFKTQLESVLGEGEFTEHEGRCCLVFRPREHRIRENRVSQYRRFQIVTASLVASSS